MFSGLGNFLGGIFHGAQQAVGNIFHAPQRPTQAPPPNLQPHQQYNLGSFLQQHIGGPLVGLEQNVVHQAQPVIKAINGNPIIHTAEQLPQVANTVGTAIGKRVLSGVNNINNQPQLFVKGANGQGAITPNKKIQQQVATNISDAVSNVEGGMEKQGLKTAGKIAINGIKTAAGSSLDKPSIISEAQQSINDLKNTVAAHQNAFNEAKQTINANPNLDVAQKTAAVKQAQDYANTHINAAREEMAGWMDHLNKLGGEIAPRPAASGGVPLNEPTLLTQQLAEDNKPTLSQKLGQGVRSALGLKNGPLNSGDVLKAVTAPLKDEGGSINLGAKIGGEKPTTAKIAPPVAKVEQASKDMQLQLGKNDKATARNLRDSYVGYKNERIVQGNQLSDQIKKLAPKEQSAIFWYNEAGGNKDLLKSWATDGEPKIAPHVNDIKAAINLSDKGKQAAGLLKNYYDQAGKDALNQGVIKSIRTDYNNSRLYKPEDTSGSVKAGTRDLNVSTGHAKQRVYNTMHEAVLNGKVPATTNAADLMSIHNEEMAKVTASKQLMTQMANSGLGKLVNDAKEVPQGWKAVDLKGIGFSQKFVAPEHLAGGLRAITDPNFLNHYAVIKNIRKFQGLVKTVDLSYSMFHHLTMTTQMLGQTLNHPANTAKIISDVMGFGEKLAPLEQDFAKHGGITSKLGQNMDVLHTLAQGNDSKTISAIKNAPGFKQLAAGTEKSSEFLFGTVQRYLKTFDYGQKAAAWVAKHPNATNEEVTMAKRSLAKEVNNAYGGLNMEAMGIDKSVQSAMRTVFLAPDWLLSNFAIGKQAFERTAGGAAARANIATTVIGGMLATEALNKTLTGHYTNQNEKGHPFEIQIQPGVYVSLMRGGIGDLIKLGSMMGESGPTTGAGRYLQGKLSPFARTGLGVLTGKNYYGADITKKTNSFGTNALNEGKFIAGSSLPVPFGVTGISSYLQNQTPQNPANPGSAALVASGLARYSKPTSPGMAVATTTSAKLSNAQPSSALTDATGTPEAKAAAAAKKAANLAAVNAGTRLGGSVTLNAAQARIDAAQKKFPTSLDASSQKILTQYASLNTNGKAAFNANPTDKAALADAKAQENKLLGKPVKTTKVAKAKAAKRVKVAKLPAAFSRIRVAKSAKIPKIKMAKPSTARAKFAVAKAPKTTSSKIKLTA